MRRVAVACVSFWLVSALFLGIGAIAANPSTDAEGGFVGRIGDERASAGLPAYLVAADLVEVARRHAQEMRRQQRLHHNPSLGDDVQGWQAVGENVGVGPSVEAIHQKFMESPSHRDNILHGRFTEVGVGVVADGTDLWVVQVFRLPQSAEAEPEPGAEASPAATGGSSPPAPAEPQPEPRPAPAPAPTPAAGASVRAASSDRGGLPAPVAATSVPAPTSTAPAVGQASFPTAATQVPTSIVEVPTSTVAEATPAAPDAAGAATLVDTDLRSTGSRQVSGPVALAATMLLVVVAALSVHVLGLNVRSAAGPAGRRTSVLDVWELALATR